MGAYILVCVAIGGKLVKLDDLATLLVFIDFVPICSINFIC